MMSTMNKFATTVFAAQSLLLGVQGLSKNFVILCRSITLCTTLKMQLSPRYFHDNPVIKTMNEQSDNGVVYAMNRFGDMTAAEFDESLKGLMHRNFTHMYALRCTRGCKEFTVDDEATDAPDEWDWLTMMRRPR